MMNLFIFINAVLYLTCVTRSFAAQIRRDSTITSYANTTTTAPSSLSTGNDTSSCGKYTCALGEPGKSVDFRWKSLAFSGQVVATVIYSVNTTANTTATETVSGTLTATETEGRPITFVNNDADFWNSVMSTTGITMSGGTPVLTFEPTIYTEPDAYITITTVLAYPTSYYNRGFLYFTAPYGLVPYTDIPDQSHCANGPATSTFAITPTITPPGFSNPYLAPVDSKMWNALIPDHLTDRCTSSSNLPLSYQIYQTALTESTTIYDDYVHSTPVAASKASPSAGAGNGNGGGGGSGSGSNSNGNGGDSGNSNSDGNSNSNGGSNSNGNSGSDNNVNGNANSNSNGGSNNGNGNSNGNNNSNDNGKDNGNSNNNNSKAQATPQPDHITTAAASGKSGSDGSKASGSGASASGATPAAAAGAASQGKGGPSATPAAGAAAVGSTAVIVDGTTITPGASAVTIAGTTYSLAPSASYLVVDGSTLTEEVITTSSGGVGEIIWSGIGGTITAKPGDGKATAKASATGIYFTTFTGGSIRLEAMKFEVWSMVFGVFLVFYG